MGDGKGVSSILLWGRKVFTYVGRGWGVSGEEEGR